MTSSCFVIPVVAALVLCAMPLPAQTSTDSTTTRSGVYTWQQARRGSDIYAGNCRGCHTVDSHTGAAFNATWNHRPLSALFQYMTERMPKNDPGSLAPREYADVLAYVLKMNGVPAGAVELPADSVRLKAIRIELPQPQTRAQP
jgi:mono/diheme cytochrome c family protein